MSIARKCDLCWTLFEPAPMDLCIESLRVRTADDHSVGWSELDFCGPCSAKVLALIGPALDDLAALAPLIEAHAAEFPRSGHEPIPNEPPNVRCNHGRYSFAAHGRICPCGTQMSDWGD